MPRAAVPWGRALALTAALGAGAAARAEAPRGNDKTPAALRYRHIGPQGNRVISVAGEPGNTNVVYAGAASGGVFKSGDAGIHWKPIFDEQDVSSIGSLAVAPSDPNVVWAGTGETFIRSNISIGDGIYKSADAGKTWARMGLERTGRIGRIVVDPRDPNVVFAAALGHSYGPQADRGVYRTRDGGKTWQRVLFVDENTGCADIAMDPTRPQILFAGMWQLVIHTWGRTSGGPGSGLYMSTDGGDTWKRLSGHGLPTTPTGKIAVAVARANPNRVYALVETADPGLYRSGDGGETWSLVSQNHDLAERPHYYTRLAVAPDDENRLYFVSVRFSVSLDGGETLVKDAEPPGGDNHDIWIDPRNPDRILVGDDGGVNMTTNRGATWHRAALPIAQMYHVHADQQIPYNVYGNRQDGESYRGPSQNREGGGRIPLSLWHGVGGCESGFAVPDPVDNNIVWSGCYDGGLQRYDERTRQARDVRIWPEAAYGWPPKDLKYRFQWTFPISISPHDHNTVYVGSQYLHRTTDGGQSWTVISPDLTTNDKTRQQSSGGLVPDNLMVEEACVLFAIAESPLERGLIWVGSNDGLVHLTRDGGAHWTNVTANIPGLPPWGTISQIEPSAYDAGAAYLAADLHQVNDRDPHVYKTSDLGKTWKSISSDLPRSVFSYVHTIREDPVRRGLLYLGTENGVYVSQDDGGHWLPLQNNLPHAPVSWLAVQEPFHDLLVATYGRGIWILDDVTPLREPADPSAAPHLFPPRLAYRFRRTTQTTSDPDGEGEGENIPQGIALSYTLKSPPKGEVTLTITDEAGHEVRTLRSQTDEPSFIRPRRPQKEVHRTTTREVGLNRVWWDLRYAPPREARLRNPPPDHPHVTPGKEGWRPLITWDLDLRGGQVGPLVAPGTYTVRLAVDGQESSQKLTVQKDPHSTGSDADVAAQLRASLELRSDLEATVDLINSLEWIRRQTRDFASMVGGEAPPQGGEADDASPQPEQPRRGEAARVLEAARDLEAKVLATEGDLFDIHLAGAREDAFRSPMKLYGRLASLASDVGASSADFPPTNQQLEVKALLHGELLKAGERYRALLDTDVTGFNALLKEKGIDKITPWERVGAVN